jgi:hypothetical protein
VSKLIVRVTRAVLFLSVVVLMKGEGVARSADSRESMAIGGYSSAEVHNPLAYGAVGDARVCTNDASIYAGDSVLTSPSARFTSADVGKPITIPGAGPEKMLGVGISDGAVSGSKVNLILASSVAPGTKIYARYWTSTKPFVDSFDDCSIPAGGHVVICSRQNFPRALRRALAVVVGAGPLNARTRSNSPLVSRINAVSPTTLTLERAATVGVSKRKMMVWFSYEEYHGITTAGQTRISFATENMPLSESLMVSVGPFDATDVAATDVTTTIRSVSAGKAKLADKISTTVHSGTCRFGKDDWKAFQFALDAAAKGPVMIGWPWNVPSAGNGRMDIAPGRAYYIGAPLSFNGSNMELRGTGAPIYYGGSGTFLRLGEASKSGTCTKSGLTALYHIDGLFVIGSFRAGVGVRAPCAGQVKIENSFIQGFVENLDVGLPGANGTSPDTKVIRTFLDRGVTNLWVHTADLFTFSDGGYYGYRDRGMVLCGDNNVDTLCHSTKIDSAEGASLFLSAAAGLDVGNIDGFEFRNIYDEPGLAHGVPVGAGPALRFGYVGSPHGGVVSGGTWSGNKVDTAVQFNAPGSRGEESDISFFGNYLVNWGIGFDLSGAKNIFAAPNRFEPGSINGADYVGIDSSDFVIDGGYWRQLRTMVGLDTFKTPAASDGVSALKIEALQDERPRYQFAPGAGMQVTDGLEPAITVIDEQTDLKGKAISASAFSAGPFFSFSTIFSARGTAIPACDGSRLHWRACVSDAPACTSGKLYGGGDASIPCEVWCNGSNWIQAGSGC